MRIRGLAYYSILPLAIGLAVFALLSPPVQRMGAMAVRARMPPAINYPARLDLGEHEVGDVVVAHFQIANSGGEELLVDEIRSNCSCSGMEQEEHGRFVPVESLRLQPGKQVELVLRVSVRGVPVGSMMVNTLEFRSNDPRQPQCRLEAFVRRVHGGPTVAPDIVCFGTVPVGKAVRHVIEVIDNSVSPRTLAKVSSKKPDRVHVRLLPVNLEAVPAQLGVEGRLIGKIEVEIDTAKPGTIETSIEIELTGPTRRPEVIPVFGRVEAAVEHSPSVLYLPRSSSSGPLYNGHFVCRSTSGQALQLQVLSLPHGVHVDILESEQAPCRRVNVTIDRQAFNEDSIGERLAIRLQAAVGEVEQLLELDVFVEK